MEATIARLVADFENGAIDRRTLIHSLAVAAAALALPKQAAAAAAAPAFKAIGIDHISYQVTDYARTRDWYADLLGMSVEGDDGEGQCRLYFGAEGTHMLPRNRPAGAPPAAPGQITGLVNHMSFQIDDWDTDRVEDELKRRGLAPRLDTGTEGRRPWASFHVKDPDGWDVQISGNTKPGDRFRRG